MAKSKFGMILFSDEEYFLVEQTNNGGKKHKIDFKEILDIDNMIKNGDYIQYAIENGKLQIIKNLGPMKELIHNGTFKI